MKVNDLVIYGAGYPDVVKLIDIINSSSNTWKIIGFLDDQKKDREGNYIGYPILGGEESIDIYARKGCLFFNNVFSSSKHRLIVASKLDKYSARYATLIAPDVDLSYVEYGFDSMIMPGVKIGANTRIGNHVELRANCFVSHDVVIGDMVFIGAGALISGRVKIGNGAYIGVGAVIREGINIGAGSLIGAGAVVVKDVDNDITVAGVPAKPIVKGEGK